MTDNPYHLERFVTAQEGVYEIALEELRRGAKHRHWIWFIFPQVAGLGTSPMATRYAIQSRREAVAYLAHPVLGPRLVACTNALLQVEGKTAREVMGTPDDLKLKSSMTLFAAVSAAENSPFTEVIACYFAGALDTKTIDYLAAHE